MHLFNELYLNSPKKFEYKTFETDFGRFGLLICYDLAFVEAQNLVNNYNVQNIIYSTYWTDIYPSMNAIDVQSGFARKNNINLLAANGHLPQFSKLGSGIYSGKYGAINYTMSTSGHSKLLVAKVPVNPKESSYKPNNFTNMEYVDPNLHSMIKVNLKKFNFVNLTEDSADSIKVAHNGFECQLEYETQSNFQPGIYQFGALNGVFFNLPESPLAGQMCLLIQSTVDTSKQAIFKKIKMISNAKPSVKYGAFPSVVTDYLKLAPSHEWIYEKGSIVSENGISRPILWVSIPARNFAADPKSR